MRRLAEENHDDQYDQNRQCHGLRGDIGDKTLIIVGVSIFGNIVHTAKAV